MWAFGNKGLHGQRN
ncbi:hypothetical protein V3C99_012837 [Haemonchus contortus]